MAILKAHHIALRARNYAAMRSFYTETLGFRVLGQIPGRNPGQDILFLDIGGTTIELISAEGAEPGKPTSGFAHLAFEVDDVDATYEALKAKGVPFHTEPRSVGDIRLAFFRDPDGNELELFKSATLTWK